MKKENDHLCGRDIEQEMKTSLMKRNGFKYHKKVSQQP